MVSCGLLLKGAEEHKRYFWFFSLEFIDGLSDSDDGNSAGSQSSISDLLLRVTWVIILTFLSTETGCLRNYGARQETCHPFLLAGSLLLVKFRHDLYVGSSEMKRCLSQLENGNGDRNAFWKVAYVP